MPDRELVNIVENASLPAVLLHVPDAQILAASAEAGRLLGVAADDLIGRNVEDFAADHPVDVLNLIASGRLAGFESERKLRRADGEVEPLQVWVRAVLGGRSDADQTRRRDSGQPPGLRRARRRGPHGPTDDSGAELHLLAVSRRQRRRIRTFLDAGRHRTHE